jgi:hypothetical protein
VRSCIAFAAAALVMFGWSTFAAAQENPLVGSWTVVDPASGQQDTLIIMPEALQFGADEPPLPYTFERSGNVVEVFIGDPNSPPATFTLHDESHAELSIPGGPTIPLTRVAAAPAEQPAEEPTAQAAAGTDAPATLLDEITAALLPYGVPTRYEPLSQSLEQLLSQGWELHQASGAQGGFTILLTNGSAHALCLLVPKNLGESDIALSDCRRLN